MSDNRSFSDHILLAFCRLGVCGLSPVMPGTCGTAFAMLIAPWTFLTLSIPERLLCLAGIFIFGALASTRGARLLGKKDPGSIVIDELAGYWLAITPFANPTWTALVAAFLLFRLFDMTKPWPISASEHWLPDGWGIMIDDIIAGLAALFCMMLLSFSGLL